MNNNSSNIAFNPLTIDDRFTGCGIHTVCDALLRVLCILQSDHDAIVHMNDTAGKNILYHIQ